MFILYDIIYTNTGRIRIILLYMYLLQFVHMVLAIHYNNIVIIFLHIICCMYHSGHHIVLHDVYW